MKSLTITTITWQPFSFKNEIPLPFFDLPGLCRDIYTQTISDMTTAFFKKYRLLSITMWNWYDIVEFNVPLDTL